MEATRVTIDEIKTRLDRGEEFTFVDSRNPEAASGSTAPEPADSTENIIAKIKAALAHSSSRHTYATFSKLAEMVDAKNVRELLAFVQTLPKPQEKSMLVSLFVARWAELEPSAALAYAQALPPGTARNSWATKWRSFRFAMGSPAVRWKTF